MESSLPRTLGAKIRALRIERGLTQGELTRGEITAGLISQIESDRVAPSFRVIQLLAEQLGIKPHDLISDLESRNLQLQIMKEAREFLQKKKGEIALALLQQLEQTSNRYIKSSELYLELAYAKQLVHHYDEAIDLYADVEVEAVIQKDPHIGALCMTRQGDLYVELGRLPLALYCYKKAIYYLSEQQNIPYLSMYDLRKTMCIILYRFGHAEKALYYAQDSYQQLQSIDDKEHLAETCNMLSVIYADLGQSDQALHMSTLAITYYQSLDLEVQSLDAKLNYAIILRELGKFEDSLYAIIPVLSEFYEQRINDGLSQAWIERATCEYSLLQFEDASRSLERAEVLLEKGTLQHAQCLRLKGQIAYAQGSHHEAINMYRESLHILAEHHIHMTSIQIHKELETIYQKIGDTRMAIISREHALALTAISEQTRLAMSVIV